MFRFNSCITARVSKNSILSSFLVGVFVYLPHGNSCEFSLPPSCLSPTKSNLWEHLHHLPDTSLPGSLPQSSPPCQHPLQDQFGEEITIFVNHLLHRKTHWNKTFPLAANLCCYSVNKLPFSEPAGRYLELVWFQKLIHWQCSSLDNFLIKSVFNIHFNVSVLPTDRVDLWQSSRNGFQCLQ